MSEAPKTIWAGGREPEWFFNDPSDHRDGGYKEYRRTDLPATDAQAFANEKVKTLVEAATAVCDDDDVGHWSQYKFTKLSAALAAMEETP